jgi:hypothetical protein
MVRLTFVPRTTYFLRSAYLSRTNQLGEARNHYSTTHLLCPAYNIPEAFREFVFKPSSHLLS